MYIREMRGMGCYFHIICKFTFELVHSCSYETFPRRFSKSENVFGINMPGHDNEGFCMTQIFSQSIKGLYQLAWCRIYDAVSYCLEEWPVMTMEIIDAVLCQ